MHFVMFYHSLVSDWNHGNAHFLRGVVSELLHQGHEVDVYEPRDGWSLKNLVSEHGSRPVEEFSRAYGHLRSTHYTLESLELARILEPADIVLVHEWSDHELVRRVGVLRRAMNSFVLLFHDTHHRAVTDPDAMRAYDFSGFDGVLAYGRTLRDLYLKRGWTRAAYVWHEAADTRVFRPLAGRPSEGDLVWIGNWGDDERKRELDEFLLGPVARLGLRARVHGVRYPDEARQALEAAGIQYEGWLANYRAPEVFARFGATVHVPRRPYVEALPGIPTIRVFEALACGIPLVCAPWKDVEGLFEAGRDYLVAQDGAAMERSLRQILHEPAMARELAMHGHRTLLSRHTCAHRVDELLAIVHELREAAGLRQRTPRQSLEPVARGNGSRPRKLAATAVD